MRWKVVWASSFRDSGTLSAGRDEWVSTWPELYSYGGGDWCFIRPGLQCVWVVCTWVVLQRSFAIRRLDLVRGRVALKSEDFVRVDGGWLGIHVIFDVRHDDFRFVFLGERLNSKVRFSRAWLLRKRRCAGRRDLQQVWTRLRGLKWGSLTKGGLPMIACRLGTPVAFPSGPLQRHFSSSDGLVQISHNIT